MVFRARSNTLTLIARKPLLGFFRDFRRTGWQHDHDLSSEQARTFNATGHLMSNHSNNNYPKLHNAMWPGLVGKGSPGAEPFISLGTMLDLSAAAEVDGIRFDGVDIFLFDPHVNIDSSDEDLKRLAEQVAARGFVVGSVVAPIWPPTGGGSAMGSAEERKKFVGQVHKGCRIAARLRELGVRPYGVVRIDSACGPTDWLKEPDANTRLIAQTF